MCGQRIYKPTLLFINQYYSPDLASTGQLITQLCESLASEFDITVLTTFPSYLQGQRDRFRLVQTELRNGVKVLRVASLAFPRTRLIYRLFNYGSYFLSCVIASICLRRRDMVIAQTDPPFIGLVAALFAARFRVPFIFVCQDLFPEVAVQLKKLGPMAVWMLRKIRGIILRRAQQIVAISEGMRQRLIQVGAEPERINVIHNWIDTELVVPEPHGREFREEHGIGESAFVVMHSGNIGYSQDFEIILAAAEQLRNCPQIQICIIGDGARRAWLDRQITQRGLRNAKRLPYQPLERIRYSLAAADLHLVTLIAGLEGAIVPSKMYGIMAAGRPTLAVISDKSEISAILQRFDCGRHCVPGDLAAVVATIQELASQPQIGRAMGERARHAVCQHFSLTVAASHYAELFRNVHAKERKRAS